MKTGSIEYQFIKRSTEQFSKDLSRIENLAKGNVISDKEISEIMSGLVAIKEIIEFMEEICLKRK